MYRAYWAIPRTLKTRSGVQTNAVFGVASMLLNILSREEPDELLFCFDAGEETFRHQENETYKEGRAETPDDFYEQIPRILDLIETFGISHVSDTQYEADDFLCTYAKAGEEADMNVTIVTGDHDCFQLANKKTRVAIPHKGYQQVEYLDDEGVEAKYGIRPDQVASYKGLCGDSSDNLPGVLGIGPKSAAALLQQHDSLKGVYEHLDDIKPSWREKLERDREQAFFCERMAELVCDIPLPLKLEDIVMEDLPYQAVLEFFGAMEFTALIKRLQALADSSYGQKMFAPDEIVSPQPVGADGGGQMSLL
jgi:DNA polymerase-1